MREYDAAHAAWVQSTNGTDEAAYLRADAALETARRALVDAQMKFPTPGEIAKKQRRIERQNRGLSD